MTCQASYLYQGNTLAFSIVISNPETGEPINITGDTVTLTIKENKNDVTPVYQVINTTHVDPTNGRTDFEITAEASAEFILKEHYMDATWLRVSANNEVYTILERSLLVLQTVKGVA